MSSLSYDYANSYGYAKNLGSLLESGGDRSYLSSSLAFPDTENSLAYQRGIHIRTMTAPPRVYVEANKCRHGICCMLADKGFQNKVALI